MTPAHIRAYPNQCEVVVVRTNEKEARFELDYLRESNGQVVADNHILRVRGIYRPPLLTCSPHFTGQTGGIGGWIINGPLAMQGLSLIR